MSPSREEYSPYSAGTELPHPVILSYVLVLVSLGFFAFGAVVHSPSTSIESCRGLREAFLMSHMSKSGTGSQLCHSSNDGRSLGSRTSSFLPIALSRESPVLNLSRRYRRTCPHDHRSALIGLYVDDLSSSTSGAIQCFVPHSSSTSSSSSFTCMAMSKSIIFKQKSGSTRRLSGLMSLCAMRS